MAEKLKIPSALNQDWSGVNQATITEPSQEPKSWGDQLHRTKEIAPSDSPVKVATTFNKINYSSSNGSAIPEVTIQDVEDALLQIILLQLRNPHCIPSHVAHLLMMPVGNLIHFYSPQSQQMLSPLVLWRSTQMLSPLVLWRLMHRPLC